MTLNKYTISRKKLVSFPVTVTITAKNSKLAWGKFCTLYFGALKPCRKDYNITKAGVAAP